VDAHPFGGVRVSELLDFGSYGSFVFIEAVADHALSKRLLLPHRNAHASRRKRVSVGIEVDNLTACVGAKAVIRHGEPSKRMRREQRFHRQQIDGCSSGAARLTPGYAVPVS